MRAHLANSEVEPTNHIRELIDSSKVNTVRDGERQHSSTIHAELLGAGWEFALVAVLLTWRWGDMGSSPGDDILDLFSCLFGFWIWHRD